MTRPVATINRVNIFSDKQVTGVRNTRVTFADGSWCDVATGQVDNKGPGFINIGGSAGQKDDEQATVGPKSFQTSTLEVRDIEADVDIKPNQGQAMVVTISGKKSGVDSVLTTKVGDCLVVSGKSGGRKASGTSVVIDNGNISIGSGNFSRGSMRVNVGSVSIGGGGDVEADVKVTITVPVRSGIKVAGVQGSVKVGDIDGPFTGHLFGDSSMSVGKVRDAQLSLQGSGDIEVLEVNDKLSMRIQGSGDINVFNGNVQTLNVDIMGSGDAVFNGTAADASLSVMGSGDIKVGHVKNKPNLSQMGSGKIKVANW